MMGVIALVTTPNTPIPILSTKVPMKAQRTVVASLHPKSFLLLMPSRSWHVRLGARVLTSQSSSEYELSVAYQMRQCAEYAKLGLAGTSVLYSSGDTGVGPSGTDATCLFQNSTSVLPCHFHPTSFNSDTALALLTLTLVLPKTPGSLFPSPETARTSPRLVPQK